MALSPWNGILPLRRRGGPRDVRRRPVAVRNLSCEALDSRQLLTTAAALPVPPPSAVETAAATLNAVNPTAFAQLQWQLSQVESQARVTTAEVRKLGYYEGLIDQGIDSGGLDANATSTVVDQVQADIDEAFLDTTASAATWAQQRTALEQLLAQDVPDQTFSPSTIRATVAEMKDVARSAWDTSQFNDPVTSDLDTLAADLGPNSGANPGPGSGGLSALQVYYDSQANSFIHDDL